MALNSGIEWTTHSWNPWVGCSKVSPGCDNCYMFRDQRRFGNDPTEIRRTIKSTWGQVKKFKAGDKVFVCSWSDFFHEGVNPMWRESALDVMRSRPDVTWMLLTKRPENFGSMLPGSDHGWPWSNIWLGVTAENQEQYNMRADILSKVPASVRFVSIEPMLGPVDPSKYLLPHCPTHDFHSGFCVGDCPDRRRGLDWVICGGESGHGARPMHPDWARSLRDQCQEAGVPFFHKQNGCWDVVYDRDKDDPDWRRCGAVRRQTPKGRWLNLAGGHGFHGDRVLRVVPTSKKKAGRLLDGWTWDQHPEAQC